MQHMEEESKRNLEVYLSWSNRTESPGRTGLLEFVGESTRQKTIAQIDNYKNLQKTPLEILGEYCSAHMCEETTWDWRKKHNSKKQRE